MTNQWLASYGDQLKKRLVLTVAASIVAKLLGFIRLQQIAVVLGVSIYADVLIIILQLIWLIETVLVSGAVAPTIVSRIYRLDSEQGQQATTTFYLHALLVCSAISIVFSLGLLLFSDVVIASLAPGLDEAGIDLFTTLLIVSIGTPLALTLSHFFSLVNRLLHNGVWYSIPQIITNSVAIAALMLGNHIGGPQSAASYMLTGLGGSLILVSIIQIYVIPQKPRHQLWLAAKYNTINALRWPKALPFWKDVSALLIAALVNEIYIYVDFFFASQLDEGSISILAYSSRLATITNMLFITSVFVILEPRWANSVAISKLNAWRKNIIPDSLSLISLMATPVSIMLFFPDNVTSLIYQSENMSIDNQASFHSLTQVFAAGALALSLSYISTRAVIIARKQRWIFFIGLVVLPLKIIFSIILMQFYGVIGLAIATTLAFLSQTIGNIVVLIRASLPLSIPIRATAVMLACYLITFSFAFSLKGLAADVGALGFIGIGLTILIVNFAVTMLSDQGIGSILHRKPSTL